MKRIFSIVCLVILILSCQKGDFINEQNIVIEKDSIFIEQGSKLKAAYIYSSSTDFEPYAFRSYTYDKNGNLIKELVSDYPKPVFSCNIYEYSDNGILFNIKQLGKEGLNYPDQTESDLSLIWEKKYNYNGNKKIEKEFWDNVLTDSSVYTYSGDLLVKEMHFDITDSERWGTIYEYDTKDNLTKRTILPEGDYTIFQYDNSVINKALHYNSEDSLVVEEVYVHTKINNKEVTEIFYQGPYGKDITEKNTTENGNIIEHIKYHPTFKGSEWWCERYEYY